MVVTVAAFPDTLIPHVPDAPVPVVGTKVVVPAGNVALVVAVEVSVVLNAPLVVKFPASVMVNDPLLTPVPPYVPPITEPCHVPAVIVPTVAMSVPVNLLAAMLPANIVLVTCDEPIVNVPDPALLVTFPPVNAGISLAINDLNVGAALLPNVGPANTVFFVCALSVADNVPVVVTALDGVELKTVPSPVNVTEETLPPLPVAIRVVPLKDKPEPNVMPWAFANEPVGFPTKLTAATC